MAVDRIYYCEGPDCPAPMEGDTPRHVQSATPPPYIPGGFIETRQTSHGDGADLTHHFCSWDCVMKYAAAQPASEYHPIDELPGEQP